MIVRNWFQEHPAEVGETYFQHMDAAFGFAARLFGASLACFMHGLFPFMFTSTGSSAVMRLQQDMVAARQHRSGRADDGDGQRNAGDREGEPFRRAAQQGVEQA